VPQADGRRIRLGHRGGAKLQPASGERNASHACGPPCCRGNYHDYSTALAALSSPSVV
jgi:hypothetical protein